MMHENESIELIQHAGSGNHGCEAIVDSLVRMLPEQRFLLLTNSRQEDEQYLPAEVKERLDIREEAHLGEHPVRHAILYAYRALTHDRESFLRYRFHAGRGKRQAALAVCIGGDNYCYPEMVGDLILTNSMLRRQGTKTILLGCSIEPEMLKRADVREDMQTYAFITARESITYEALLGAGVPEERITLCPDPAFTLPAAGTAAWETNLAGMAKDRDLIGINLSPMALHYAAEGKTVLSSFEALLRHILETTRAVVVLVPHVVWDRSNDLIPLQQLYDAFKSTGRVILLPDQRAEALKEVISHCRLFIGARTHATIAAYSSCVPTLVLGYSVKAKGIARDLFGTEDHYVLPVQQLNSPAQLIEAFEWLRDNEELIREKLEKEIPAVQEKAQLNAAVVRRTLKQTD